MGVGDKMGKIEIDDRGRITIPKEMREELGLKPGDGVRIKKRDDALLIEKEIDLPTFIDEMKGCITVKGEIDPLKMKEIWRTLP